MDWDRPGALSIVVQGALFQGDVIATANHCRHWRALFPQAQIILVISVTDVVTGVLEDGVFQTLRLVHKHRHDGHLQAALQIILDCCDKVGQSPPALPLPPIKRDSPKLNNMNFQISAARHGLEMAKGQFVLRIRSDMIFLNRDFLEQYRQSDALPRREASVFERRVMISWLFTLNPYSTERMPLHFSDWFHFGLTEDVRRIWKAPEVTFQDSLFYRTQPHLPDANDAERLFNIRLAVEQHLMYHCFKPVFPELVLDRHNDRTSIDLSMEILADNFVLCDMLRAHCIFEKYNAEFYDPSKRDHCVTPEGWRAIALKPGGDYRTVLLQSGAEPAPEPAPAPAPVHHAPPVRHAVEPAPTSDVVPIRPDMQTEEAPAPEPSRNYRYGTDRLRVRGGTVVGDTIVSTATDGLLFYGPYVSLPAGRYVATVAISGGGSSGSIDFRVTLNCGETVLARKKTLIGAGPLTEVRIPFDIAGNDASELEVVCTMKGVQQLVVRGLLISERTGSDERTGSPWLALKSALQPRRI